MYSGRSASVQLSSKSEFWILNSFVIHNVFILNYVHTGKILWTNFPCSMPLEPSGRIYTSKRFALRIHKSILANIWLKFVRFYSVRESYQEMSRSEEHFRTRKKLLYFILKYFQSKKWNKFHDLHYIFLSFYFHKIQWKGRYSI